MTSNSGDIIAEFASFGYMIEPAALRYLARHNSTQILNVASMHLKSTLVLTLPLVSSCYNRGDCMAVTA